jgi:hypothetical protein
MFRNFSESQEARITFVQWEAPPKGYGSLFVCFQFRFSSKKTERAQTNNLQSCSPSLWLVSSTRGFIKQAKDRRQSTYPFAVSRYAAPSSAWYRSMASSVLPRKTTEPKSNTQARSQILFTSSGLWETNTMVFPALRNCSIRAMHFL